MATKLLYLEDFNLAKSPARVADIVPESEGGRIVILLDQTIFYPQGGGQPFDQGIIAGDSGTFSVEEVRFVGGEVKHIGKFLTGNIAPGEIVRCEIDQERRALHSRLHSAGHVVDMAVYALQLAWTPGKGYHFPDGPYVEYSGNLEGIDKEAIKARIEGMCNELIAQDRKTALRFMPKEEVGAVCHFVPDYLPEGKPARVVMYGDFGMPCGGTHVNNLMAIGRMTIRKVKDEKGNIRVGYDVERA